MILRRAQVLFALIASIAVALVGFRLLNSPMRTLEETAVLRVFVPVRDHTTVVGDHNFQVLSPGHFPFRAVLTPYCSSLVSILALGAIAVFILRGPILRRLSAFIVAGMFVLCCNVVRIGGSLWAGLRYGPGGLVLFHDWLGTMFGLLYTLFGFLLMLYLMLPSATADIARAARTSDVL
jgi:carbamoyl-phosphate synthase large subunit